MGNARWFFSFSGVILLVGAIAHLHAGAQLRHRLRVRHAHHHAARAAGERGRRARCARAARLRRRQDPADRRPRAGRQRLPDLGARARPERGGRGGGGARRLLRGGGRRLLLELDRPDLRRADRADRADRGDRLAAPDLALHRLPLRVEVRRADPDRAGARPADHQRRLRPVRKGGHDLDGRRPAHDHGLLALRHGDRVRPHPRERAAHAARHLLADREPLDVRGVHAIAGHELRGADAGRRAAALRRRHAQGLRLRPARGRGLGRLLVDLHRHPGAGGVEGARAGLHASPPRGDGAARRAGARLRHRRRGGRAGRGRCRRRQRRGRARRGAAPAAHQPGRAPGRSWLRGGPAAASASAHARRGSRLPRLRRPAEAPPAGLRPRPRRGPPRRRRPRGPLRSRRARPRRPPSPPTRARPRPTRAPRRRPRRPRRRRPHPRPTGTATARPRAPRPRPEPASRSASGARKKHGRR